MKTAIIYITATEGISEEILQKAETLIPDWRRNYSAKKRLPDRINSVFSYLLLQRLIKEEFGLTDQAPFTYKEAGKPFFSQLDLFFSLSHCKTAVGAAASSKEIGFDIIDNRIINEKAAVRICSPDEWNQYGAASDKQKFLRRLWCKKESMVKQSGTGFTKGFDTVDTAKARFFCCERENFYASLYFGASEEKTAVRLEEVPWQRLL